MKKYILSDFPRDGENNAGYKARKDVIDILFDKDYKLETLYIFSSFKVTFKNIISAILRTIWLIIRLRKNDIVFLQYPMNRYLLTIMYKLILLRKVHIITLLHDIDYLRNIPLRNHSVNDMRKLELSLFKKSEYLICHNEHMYKKIQEHLPESKIVSLGVFDYLYQGPDAKISKDKQVIVIAGNLTSEKAEYVYKLIKLKRNYYLSLYGSGLKYDYLPRNVIYNGSFPPDGLIEKIEGTYGLVWDGLELNNCAGSYGEYLRYNNPHKLSLYVAAGLPVIVWKEAAISTFVKENMIGFCVDSLHEISTGIILHQSEYQIFLKNISIIGLQIKTGGFLKEAINKIENNIETSDMI